MAERRHSLRRGLAVGSVVLGLAFLGGAQVRAQNIVDDVEQESELRRASACVAVDYIIRTNADTLLQLATSESDPEQIKRFKALVEGDVLEGRTIIGAGTPCNLAEAKALLETEKGNS